MVESTAYKDILTDELIPYARNSRTHSESQVTQIASSIREFGFTNPVLVDAKNSIIAGHGRVMAAKKLGLESVPCLVLSHLSEAQKKAYVIADNQLALNAGWDNEMLKLEVEELAEMDFDLDLLGFDSDFMDLLVGEDELLEPEKENPYNSNIAAPTYEPKNEKPSSFELLNNKKTSELIEKINLSGVTQDEKSFLIKAAERHCIFDFSKVADYYAHSNDEMQDLMEQSALVIIDYDKAIENGFIQISKEFEDQTEKAFTDE